MNINQIARCTLAVLLLSLVWHSAVAARDSVAAQDQRDIEAKEVLQSRREGKQAPNRNEHYRMRRSAPSAQPTVARHKPAGKSAPAGSAPQVVVQNFPLGTPSAGKSYVTLGITLWRVREATPAQRQDAKVMTQRMTWNRQERDVVVTRSSDESPVTNGDLIQLSIEYLSDAKKRTNSVGYLYVINCEQLADGSWQNARLIFPTQKSYGGDNRLLPGQTVTLPDPQRPFIITRSHTATAQQSEVYLIIVSPVPLDEQLPQELSQKAMELSPELAMKWWRQWGGGEVRADLQAALGRTRTPRELAANGDPSGERGTEDADENLTQDDAPPQMVFRKAVTTSGKMLVTVKLLFRQTR